MIVNEEASTVSRGYIPESPGTSRIHKAIPKLGSSCIYQAIQKFPHAPADIQLPSPETKAPLKIAAILAWAEPHPFGHHQCSSIGEPLDVGAGLSRTIVAGDKIFLARVARRLSFGRMTELALQLLAEAVAGWV